MTRAAQRSPSRLRRASCLVGSLALAASLALTASACPLFMSPAPTVDVTAGPGYYSKTLTYYRYIDPAEAFYEPVEVRIYDKDGRLSGVYVHTYAEVGTDYWALSRTDFYAVNKTGDRGLAEYFIYTYKSHAYADPDEGAMTEYVLTKGESFASNKTCYSYYDVIYLEPADQPCVYLTVRDWELDSAGVFQNVALDESKYRLINGTYCFVTEKSFAAAKPGDTLKLTKEFATWYKVMADGTVRYTHDLYHTMIGDTSGEETWFYTKYDWNGDGRVFSQQDFVYTIPSGQKLSGASPSYLNGTINPWITIPGLTNVASVTAATTTYGLSGQGFPEITLDAQIPTYDVAMNNLGDLKETLTKRYDELGNVMQKVRSSQGHEFERIEYRYDGENVISMIRYMNGKSYAYDRTETRYYTETRDGVLYDVTEELVYRSYASDITASVSASSLGISNGARNAARSLEAGHKDYFHRIRRNHDR